METEATTNTTSAETVEFLDTVDAVASGTPWVIKVQLNNRDLEFKVDTGADVTVLPEGNYQPGRDGALETTMRKLSGPTGDKLKVLGKISGYIKRQSNGTAERVVKTVKSMFKKNEDPHMALLILRSTPLENGFSPAELLMSRKVRTTLPVTETQLLPSILDRELVRQREEQSKQKMKENFDRRHKAIPLPSLQKDGKVWIPEFKTSGTVIEETRYPRSYRVQTPTGVLRRNRRDLVSLPKDSEP